MDSVTLKALIRTVLGKEKEKKKLRIRSSSEQGMAERVTEAWTFFFLNYAMMYDDEKTADDAMDIHSGSGRL